MKFRNSKDHALSFLLHGVRVEVAAKGEFEVPDHHGYAVTAMGLPVELVVVEAEPESAPKPVKGPDGKFVKKSG